MRPDTKRLLQHIPPGMLAAFLCYVLPIMGVLYYFGFWLYEYIQEWRKADKSYKDCIGFLDGFTGMAILICLWRLFH